MKQQKKFFPVVIMALLFFLLSACKKDENEIIEPEPEPEIIKDIDGNVYHTVSIGEQVWMLENLKTTRYRNGDQIPHLTGETWDDATTGAYCSYDNQADNITTYGLLYNWHALEDDRGICPEGWHIPTMAEWETLAGEGLELKAPGTTFWMSPNVCLPDVSGFKALPGGNCAFDGAFSALTESGYWWTRSEDDMENAWLTIISHYNAGISGWLNMNKWLGASVRCVQD